MAATSPIARDRPPATPTLLVGIGAVGQRVATRVRERLEAEPLARAGGLVLLPFAEKAAFAPALRDAVVRLTMQRTISGIEPDYAIRQPAHRYLKLQVVCVAALAEAPSDALRECLRAVYRLKHPTAGLEILFVLDGTAADDVNEVAPDALATLQALQEEGYALTARRSGDWSAVPRLRFLVAHPHRADGSRLDHPFASVDPSQPSPSKGEGWVASLVPEPLRNQNQVCSGSSPDEFEATLAAALGGHIAVGTLHDGLGQRAEEVGRPPFALFGWAGETLPRERLLERAGQLLAADLLERSADFEPGRKEAESMLTAQADRAWEDWVRGRDAVLLNRRRLLERLLSPGAAAGAIVVGDPPPHTPRRSWYRKLRERYWGVPEPDDPSTPLLVRMNLPAIPWRASDPTRWPEEVRSQDARAEAELDRVLAVLNVADLPQQTAEEIAVALAQCADLCVTRHLGGTQAARALMDQAVAQAESAVHNADRVRFAEPIPPEDLGLGSGASLQAAWEAFKTRCERLPGWPAVLARGLAYATLCLTACLALHGALALGATGAVLSVAGFAGWYVWALGRCMRTGNYVTECLRAKYGRRLFDYAQAAAGTSKKEGVYQAIVRYLRTVELPAVARFEAERSALIAQVRLNPPFPPLEGTAEAMVGAEAAADLHALVREGLDDSALADDARTLLRGEDLYHSWRYPAMDRIQAQAGAWARRAHLLAWERPNKTLGRFLRDLLRRHLSEPAECDRAFRRWVGQRMDLLAARSLLLALRPPVYPERDNAAEDAAAETALLQTHEPGALQARWLAAVPASLEWERAAAGEEAAAPPAPDMEERDLPAGTAAANIGAWFGATGNAGRWIAREDDTAACLVIISGLTPERAVWALGQDIPPAETAAPAAPAEAAGPPDLRLVGDLPSEPAAAPASGATQDDAPETIPIRLPRRRTAPPSKEPP